MDISPLTLRESNTLALEGKMGMAESTRVLQHLMKPGIEFKKGPSRWLHSSIEESMEYLQNWKCWESRDPLESFTIQGEQE